MPPLVQTGAVVRTLDKIAFLQEHNVGAWDLSTLTPNRREWLAKKSSRVRADNLTNVQDR